MTLQEDTEFEWDVRDELLGAMARHLAKHERSQQVEIGPSGMGTPCSRRLGYQLAHVPKINDMPPDDPDDIDALINNASWRPAVGTVLHAQQAEILENLNALELSSELHVNGSRVCKAPWCDNRDVKHPHTPRYLVEFDVVVGTLNSTRQITGHVDFYDHLRKLVGDWKFPGPAKLKEYHAACSKDDDPHPSKEYREQSQIYARGVAAMGKPVERIANVFIPMNGELRDSFVWSERFDPEIGKAAFVRARKIAEALRLAQLEDGAEGVGENGLGEVDRTIARLKTAPHYCTRCPWFKSGVEFNTTQGCAGDSSIFVKGGNSGSSKALQDLMGDD